MQSRQQSKPYRTLSLPCLFQWWENLVHILTYGTFEKATLGSASGGSARARASTFQESPISASRASAEMTQVVRGQCGQTEGSLARSQRKERRELSQCSRAEWRLCIRGILAQRANCMSTGSS